MSVRQKPSQIYEGNIKLADQVGDKQNLFLSVKV